MNTQRGERAQIDLNVEVSVVSHAFLFLNKVAHPQPLICLVSLFSLNSERITLRQAQVDKLYAGLKDLAEERRGRLQERLRLTQLKREVDDLEQWIAEREVVAGSHELGQDYEHVTVRFFFGHMLWRP